MTLREFLLYFDFDYKVDKDGIGLIDLQGANLGDICSERYSYDQSGVRSLLDRLDIYYKDYIFDDLEEVLEKEHGINTSNMSWKDLYHTVQKLNLDYDMDIMPYIFGDKKLDL